MNHPPVKQAGGFFVADARFARPLAIRLPAF
jgi:hypothetical protein